MDWKFDRVSVVGLGYIGLPTAAMFASRKIHVIGIDVSEHTVETINRGNVHIVEPDLDIAVSSAVSQGYLRATTTPESADAFLIAVPTPFKGSDHEPDLAYVEAACRSIAGVLEIGNLIVLESTSPIGTTDRMSEWLAVERPDLSFPHQAGEAADIRIAHCPERVLPGRVMQELIHNDRVIGGLTPGCSDAALALYRIFVKGACVVTDARTAEMAKLTENAFRDVNIAFANELSVICERHGVDVWELIRLANRHPRVNILQPGPGVGGHCIAVDPWFIVSSAPDLAKLTRAAREVNDGKPDWVLGKVDEAIAEAAAASARAPEAIRIACYGLAFKPDIDDLRESPALHIVEALAKRFAGKLIVVEPNIDALPASLDGCTFAAVDDELAADVHLMLVDHRAFHAMPRPDGVIVDTRGVWTGAAGGVA